MIFSLALSRPNNANQLIRYNNQLTIVEQRFTNIAAVQNMGVLQQIWINKIYGGILLICQNTTMWIYGAWIKRYCALCSTTYSTSSSIVVTSCWFSSSRLRVPAYMRLVYSNPAWIKLVLRYRKHRSVMDRFSYKFSVKAIAFRTPLCFVMKIYEFIYCDLCNNSKIFYGTKSLSEPNL